MIKKLDEYLAAELKDDLEQIHFSLRVSTDIGNLLRAIEKYFGGTANYAKGKGSMFMDYMRRYHPTAYLYSVARACGGSRQDIGTEGAIPVLMNIPFYLEFLIWRMRCGGDGILEKSLYHVLRSIEMVSLLRVLSILHISICIPLRWLAGNCGDLGGYGFGVAEMPKALDLMDVAFAKIAMDGELMMDEDFMMSIFKPLSKDIQPFQSYLDYMFMEKRSSPVGSRDKKEKVLPFHLLRNELFLSERIDIIQSNPCSTLLCIESACEFRVQFRDGTKATAKYLKAIKGKKSMARGKVKRAERMAGRGIDATNSISESLHAASTYGLQQGSTIRLYHCAAEGQTRANNDFGRNHVSLVSGRKAKHGHKTKAVGTFHLLPPELQRTALIASKENATDNRRRFDVALEKQFEKRRRKEEIALDKKYKDATEEYIVALYFFEQYHSPRCWTCVDTARIFYLKLKSETARLAAVKEQILIRYLGLGWVEAHHAWSEEGATFTSRVLLTHLLEVVIPLAGKMNVPAEPPLNVPALPQVKKLGTVSELAEEMKELSDAKLIELRKTGQEERDDREAKGDGDRWFEKNQICPPEIEELNDFRIEMLFAYSGDDGTQCLGWYQGTVIKIVNTQTNRVRIEWDSECLGDRDVKTSDHKLVPGNWNPKEAKKGGWREYLTKK